jgi:signal peptidase I
MEPNFHAGQVIVVNRFAYYFAKPSRGDVVVLHSPRGECRTAQPDDANCEDLIKRVIGLPGELVQIDRGRVYINGSLLDEPYVIKGFCESCHGDWIIGPDQYFVLGDNRDNSMDSHSFGPISRDLIVGEAWIRYWPPQDASVIPHPGYVLGSKVLAPPSPTAQPTFTPTPALEANIGHS